MRYSDIFVKSQLPAMQAAVSERGGRNMPNIRKEQNRLRVFIAENHQALADIEKQYRPSENGIELIPYAMNTSYTELAEHIFAEKGVKNPGLRYRYPI